MTVARNYRTNDPVTSVQAGLNIIASNKKDLQCKGIMQGFTMNPDKTFTAYEIVYFMKQKKIPGLSQSYHIAYHQVHRRLGDLRKQGRIEVVGKRICQYLGKTVQHWKITEDHEDLVRDEIIDKLKEKYHQLLLRCNGYEQTVD